MINPFIGKICRIIMITSNKNNPVVCFVETTGNSIIYLIVIARFFESKAAISSNN